MTISCRSGYRLVGPATRTCQQNGTWGGGETTCVQYACPRLAEPVNGNVFVLANSQATYACLAGYTLNGESVLNCLDNDTWSSPPPTCDAVRCENLTAVGFENGQMTFVSFTFGSTVTFACNVGYTLNGARRIECGVDGSWSSAMPVCEKITCYPPYVPPRSHFTANGEMKYETTIEFFCEEGYRLEGESIRTCRADGSWSGSSHVCQQIVCPYPNPNQHVIVRGSAYAYGNVLQYSCNEGFRLDGPESRTCTADGTWSGDEPLCTRDECIRTRPLLHGSISGFGSRPGDQVFFQCDEGYELVGLPFKFCMQLSLEWSNPDPTCRKVKCPTPPELSNGVYTGNDFFFQDTVVYQCNPGYEIVGQNTITCLSVGQWSRTDVACLRISCGPPPVVRHAAYTLNSNEDEGKFNDTVDLSCLEGYVGQGVSFQRCQANGAWTQTDFSCEVVECPPFRAIPNGNFKGIARTYGSIVEVECNQGFYLVGKASRKCGGDGNWEDEYEPYCERIECEVLNDISNGKTISGDRHVNSTVTFQCDEGYRLHGTDHRFCQSDGNWSGSNPYCRLITCVAPPSVPHANNVDTLTEYLYRSTVRYTCKKGYRISAGDSSLVCSADGSWQGTVPTCSIVKCGEPDTLPNGRYFIASHNYLSEVQYICLSGYQLKGSETVICDETGSWSGALPSCIPIDCGPPPYVVNSKSDDTGVHTFNTEVSYNCDIGFVLAGQQSVRCEATGVWSSPPPDCEPISCGPPPVIEHASYNGDDFFYLDRVTYECDSGFTSKGNTVLQCSYDGSWQGDRPSCEALSCGPPPQLLFANTVLSGGTGIGTKATFQCDPGYYLVGSATAVCLADLKWKIEGNDPFCHHVDCGPPPQIDNGQAIYTSTTYDASAIFECNEGFSILVEGEMVCSISGRWEGTKTVCEPSKCSVPPTGDNMHFIGDE